MAFLNIFKKIGAEVLKVVGDAAKVAEVVTPALQPVLGPVLTPAAESIATLIDKAVGSVETIITGVGQGVQKKQTAEQIIQAELPQLDAVIAELGTKIKITPEIAGAVGAAIDGAVAVKNAISQILTATKQPQSS